MTSSLTLPKSLSVTKVRLAFECPRLMYLGHHEKVMTMFRASNSAGGGIGTAFHKLCDDCVNRICRDSAIASLFTPSANELDPSVIAQQLQQYLYRTVFFPLVQDTKNNNPKKITGLNQLWEGITGLIRQWATLLVRNRDCCSAQDVIRKTFLAQELSVKYSFDLPNGEQQLVRGRFDSLVYDFKAQRLCVVEYKTYQATDPAAQLVQVALYSYMLKQRLQVSINSAVYSVLPDWHGVEYSWDQLEKSLHQLIPHKLQQIRAWLAWQPATPNPPPVTVHPKLCDICPQKSKCSTYFDIDLSETDQVRSRPAAVDALPSDDVVSVDIPPLLVGTVKDGFTVDASTPVKVDLLQVGALQVGSVQGQSIQSGARQPSTSTPVAPPPSKSRDKSDPPAKTVSTRSVSVDSVVTDSPAADQTARDLVEILQAFKVGVDYVGVSLGPAFMRVKLKPQRGVRVSSILKFEDDIRVHLALQKAPLMAPQAGYISVDVPRPDRQTAFFKDYLERSQANQAARIAIGVNLDGQLVEADLSDSNTCHFLVGGTTGSGKSEFLRSLLLSLLVRHDPDHLQIALVDPKRVTFPEFETMQWLYEPIVKDAESTILLMERLVDEMELRYQQFEKNRCSYLSAYNQQSTHPPLPRIVCIFDEYADFMAEKEIAKELEQSIKRLGAKARAAGIHLIIATQRPEAKVVTPLIRSNLPGRIALRTATAADSSIILGSKQEAAVNLLGKGDLFYSGSGSLLRLQSLFATAQTVTKLID